MSGCATFEVSSAEEAARAMEHFNGFHDGFMKRIAIASRDEVRSDLSQTCTGTFDVEIDFAHYNYPGPAGPLHAADNVIRGQFRNVRDMFWDLREGFLGNTIISLTVVAANRRKGGEAGTEPCLCLLLGRHFHMEEQRRYEYRELQAFTFLDATLAELPLPR